jgi:MFS family permease
MALPRAESVMLPAGWLGDHWSRRNPMMALYIGCGLSLVAASLAPS